MIKAFLCGLTIGGVGATMAMQYHVVRTSEKFLVVSRIHQPPVRSSYVDVRDWTPAMWQQFPELTEAMKKAGHEELLVRDNRKQSQPVHPLNNAIPDPAVVPPSQQAVNPPSPYSALPTSLIRPVPPTAWGTSAQESGAASNPRIATQPAVEPIQSPGLTNLVIPYQPIQSSEAPIQKLPPDPHPVIPEKAPAESSKPGWFGDLLKSVIPKVGMTIQEGREEATALAKNWGEQLKALSEVPQMIAEEATPSTPSKMEVAENAKPIPSVEAKSVPATTTPDPNAFVPVEPVFIHPAVITDSRGEFPRSPYRIERKAQ